MRAVAWGSGLFVSWVVFPLVLGLVCLGCGVVLGRAAGAALPVALVLPCGFALVVVVSGWTTAWSLTTGWTVPLVVGLAGLGLLLLPRRWPGSEARVVLAVMVVTYLLFGAPVLSSGTPTFAGYSKLDDTATFLALTDRALVHGRDLSALAPSSYEASLAINLANGYPLGSLTPLGVGARLVGSDPAWLWQPFISFAAALLAASLYGLAGRLDASRLLRAGLALVAAQAALLYGFALWGGVKEVVAAALLVLAVATIPFVRLGRRGVVVPAVVWAAFLDVMSLGGVVWLAPIIMAALVWPARATARRLVALGSATVVLSLPALLAASAFLRAANVTVFRSGDDLGNLARPLRWWQVFGVWPAADFRFDPDARWLTWALVLGVAAAAATGVVVAVRRRADLVLVLAGSVLLGAVAVVGFGSPWIGAKALAIASPIALFVAGCGCVSLLSSRRGVVAGALLSGVLVAGVFGSNLLAYRAVWLAPHGQLAELEWIGNRFAGKGPTLMTEYQPYGVRHFLRRLDAEGASELRRRAIPLRTARILAKGEYADIDEFELTGLLMYRTLVLRRSPVASRPPSPYRLAYRGDWYDVWTRDNSRHVLAHEPLGTASDPVGRADCKTVHALAATAAQAGGHLVVPSTPAPIVVDLGQSLPTGWTPPPGLQGAVIPTRAGITQRTLLVPSGGRYTVWVAGSVSGSLRVLVDGRPVGSIRDQINPAGTWMRLGATPLESGSHTLRLELRRPALRGGATAGPFTLGPVALAREPNAVLQTVDPTRAEALCNTQLDWVEAVAPK